MRKILFPTLGLLGLAAAGAGLPATAAEARALAQTEALTTTMAAVLDQGVAAQDESAASRRGKRRHGASRRGGTTVAPTQHPAR